MIKLPTGPSPHRINRLPTYIQYRVINFFGQSVLGLLSFAFNKSLPNAPAGSNPDAQIHTSSQLTDVTDAECIVHSYQIALWSQ